MAVRLLFVLAPNMSSASVVKWRRGIEVKTSTQLQRCSPLPHLLLSESHSTAAFTLILSIHVLPFEKFTLVLVGYVTCDLLYLWSITYKFDCSKGDTLTRQSQLNKNYWFYIWLLYVTVVWWTITEQ